MLYMYVASFSVLVKIANLKLSYLFSNKKNVAEYSKIVSYKVHLQETKPFLSAHYLFIRFTFK